MSLFIAIAGNIGVGKSTLSERLATRLGWELFPEPAVQNPYLSDFYGSMERWAFHSQVYFLAHQLQQHHELIQIKGGVIQDRSVYESVEIFGRNLYNRGHLSQRDWTTYRMLYDSHIALLPPPSLIIYLEATIPTLVTRIRSRGRKYEQDIDEQYLGDLHRLYEEWATSANLAPVMRIPTDEINFVSDTSAVDALAKKIIAALPTQQLPLFAEH